MKQFLESHGISCFLKDELTIQANPLYTYALGGVKIQVPESREDEARAILKANGYYDEPEKREISLSNATGELAECPACGSEEVSLVKGASSRIVSYLFLLLGIPVPFRKRYFHCFNCGAEIRVRKEESNK